MSVPSKTLKTTEESVQPKKQSREEEKSAPCFMSNDSYLWCEINPDLVLIEPQINVSVNYNYLGFSRKPTRPPESRKITLINHGDYPIAFKVETTDNFSYFVDRRNGVLPPRQTVANMLIRMPNTTEIQNASREVAVEEQLVKNPSIPIFPGIAPLPNRPPTPTIAIMPGRRRQGVRMVRNMSPFNRTQKTQSETPKQFPTPNTTPRIPVITPFNKSGENQKPPGGKKSIETPKKPSTETPVTTPHVITPVLTMLENPKAPIMKRGSNEAPRKKSNEHARSPIKKSHEDGKAPPKAISPKAKSPKAKSPKAKSPIAKSPRGKSPKEKVQEQPEMPHSPTQPKNGQMEKEQQQEALSPKPKKKGSGEATSPKPTAHSPS
ncbi:hypothetical protein CRE_16189 [Caenorhabditis remanei]|uniref:Major sperm protein n=1 Tax=Caenorhabditis remanei TaxID=31234 RepID=E3MSH4_CAERE|nr:hypothetical protein CRE_16189 [Caenorhabditis remanei]